MIEITNTEVVGWEHAIRGMRNPMNSWDKSDSHYRNNPIKIYASDGDTVVDVHDIDNYEFDVGANDLTLMKKLAKAGPVHSKFMRMIVVYCDINAPMYWWKEFDTYKVGTVRNSCSTMHKIHSKEFTLDDFSHEHLKNQSLDIVIDSLNKYRNEFVFGNDKDDWWQMIQLLPSSYNQKSTVMLNYEVLKNIYTWRKDHKLDEWKEFCKWIESLPYSELIINNRRKI